MSDDTAGECDGCDGPLLYDETCYMVPNGETEDGLPVIKLLCRQCHLG